MDIVFNPKLRLFAPEKLKEEFLKHKEEIGARACFTKNELDIVVSLLLNRIHFVPREEYKNQLTQARELLKGHNKDEDFLALCLAKRCKLWTYETRFFKIKYAISTKELAHTL